MKVSEHDYLKALNQAQRQAVIFGNAYENPPFFKSEPLLVLAGAGTGKTNTLAHRVAHLIVNGVDPFRILLLTFTRRAAQEMTRRVAAIVKMSLTHQEQTTTTIRIPWSGTFHSIANRLLRDYADNLGLDQNFSVADRSDAADLMDVARQRLGFSELKKRFPRKDTCLSIYSRCVNMQAELEQCLIQAYPWCLKWHDELRRLFRLYVELKQTNQVLDYDDLLLYWYYLLKEPSFQQQVSSRFDHILVDEYQDTNNLQSNVLQMLRPNGQGLTVVGDDAQSIYSFRAARVENILEFPNQFQPPAHIVVLEENYRSHQAILDVANTVIFQADRQYQKKLYSKIEQPSNKPYLVSVSDEREQAQYVVRTVLENREAGIDLNNQAVLFRNSSHSDMLELALMQNDIPFVKYGGLKFLEAAHVKDLLALLKWADNPKNQIASSRVLQLLPGIGPKLAEKVFINLSEKRYNFSKIEASIWPKSSLEVGLALMKILDDIHSDKIPWPDQVGYACEWYIPILEQKYNSAMARLGDLDQLQQLSTGHQEREQFLTELTLDPPQATSDLAGPPSKDEEYLILSTIHSAKGQEWDAVFLLNVSDGVFPSEFSTDKKEMIEEERRLLYVALTRAKSQLHLLTPLKYYIPQKGAFSDQHVYGAKSRFLTKSVEQCLEKLSFHSNASVQTTASENLGKVSIDVGDKLKSMW